MFKKVVICFACLAALFTGRCTKDQPLTVNESNNSPTSANALSTTPIPKTDYSLDGSTGNGGATYLETKVWDGSNSTFWCSPYTSGNTKPFPQFLSIKIAKAYDISSFKYMPRQDAARGRIKDYEILVVKTGSTAWQSITTGTIPNSTAEQTVSFTLQSGVTKFLMNDNYK